MKFENICVYNFQNALRGMRNPKESWHLSDTKEYLETDFSKAKNVLFTIDGIAICVEVGPNDLKLAQTLIRAGSEHRKFMREITVSMDITAPLYWWKEFDTYKVGTVANSTSTMHKLMTKPITLESFEIDDYNPNTTIESANENDNLSAHWNWQVKSFANSIISHCEDMRQTYLNYVNLEKNADTPEHKKLYSEEAYKVWKELVRWLPESWLQMRTVTLTYENLYAMCSPGQRRFHKLNEWSGKKNPKVPNFIAVARTLPCAQDFIFLDELSK